MPALLKFKCNHCSQPLEMSAETQLQTLNCPVCQGEIALPGTTSVRTDAVSRLCAVCQCEFAQSEARVACPGCGAEYHPECWEENHGCAVYGCSQVPPTEGRGAAEIPVGYWGQEYKPCPVCNTQILAAAVRCRHCGSTFQTARPVGANEFTRGAALAAQAPGLKRAAVWIFALCVLPFTAPIAAVAGLIWIQTHREGIRTLPALFSALPIIGVAVGFFQTAALVFAALLFSIFRSPAL
jgi:hypothetical protein